MSPSAWTGTTPPPKGTEAYERWLQGKSNKLDDQPLGEIDHNAFIASQFTNGVNTHEESRKAKRARKTARSAQYRAQQRAEGEAIADRARVTLDARRAIRAAQAEMERE